MKNFHVSFLVSFTVLSISCSAQSADNSTTITNEKYVCLPCGRDCDKQVSGKAGTCTHCNMPLVKQSTVFVKSIEPKIICDSLSKMKEVLVIDVRSPEEFEGKASENYGRLKNALNIPLQQLESRMEELSAHTNKKIIVYCSHGHRSATAAYMLSQNGFTNVVNMSGGMSVLFDEQNTSCIQH